MAGAADDTGATLLSVRSLRLTLDTDEGRSKILDDVSISLVRGKILGIVGESGCGKSTLVKAVLGVRPRGAVIEHGAIRFDGIDLVGLDEKTLNRDIRGSRIGFIPQDPYLAFNPVFTVGTQLLDLMRWHAPGRRATHRGRLIELLQAVQIPDPEGALARYPHEFSGGQRQRLMIAAALACEPQIIIADEPTSALDVTTQLQILLLLKRLTQDHNIAVLFVTHDFGVVAQLCDTVSVMYAGQTVETGRTSEILERPRHPYTRLLLRCHPDQAEELVAIPGSVPSPTDPPSGCRFHPRCPSAMPECASARPPATRFADGAVVHCLLYPAGVQETA